MNKNLALAGVVGAIAIALTVMFSVSNEPQNESGLATQPSRVAVRNSPEGLPGLLSTAAPWPNNTSRVTERLTAIGLPQLKEAGSIKTRGFLELITEGKSVAVPAGIGQPADSSFVPPITTKDGSGIFTSNAPTETKYYLGQLFDLWGVRLDSNCIGGYCTDGTKRLQIFADGTEVITDPRKLELRDQQVIVVTYGTTNQLPAHIRRSYIFPN